MVEWPNYRKQTCFNKVNVYQLIFNQGNQLEKEKNKNKLSLIII